MSSRIILQHHFAILKQSYWNSGWNCSAVLNLIDVIDRTSQMPWLLVVYSRVDCSHSSILDILSSSQNHVTLPGVTVHPCCRWCVNPTSSPCHHTVCLQSEQEPLATAHILNGSLVDVTSTPSSTVFRQRLKPLLFCHSYQNTYAIWTSCFSDSGPGDIYNIWFSLKVQWWWWWWWWWWWMCRWTRYWLLLFEGSRVAGRRNIWTPPSTGRRC